MSSCVRTDHRMQDGTPSRVGGPASHAFSIGETRTTNVLFEELRQRGDMAQVLSDCVFESDTLSVSHVAQEGAGNLCLYMTKRADSYNLEQ